MNALETNLRKAYEQYFGVRPGGADLRGAIVNLPWEPMAKFQDALRRRPARGRVFFMGNGGSYDNARLMAQRCRAAGIAARTPGHEDDYLHTAMTAGYADIFRRGLEQDAVGPGDIVVGISGSGNSENILAALGFAREKGAAVFCLGGRDGGKMAPLCGPGHSMIVANQCMEAIEDLHMIIVLLILESLAGGNNEETRTLARARDSFLQRFDTFLNVRNEGVLVFAAARMLSTIETGGRVFILGAGIGANHFRADMGRGATNAIPVRGLSTPECFTMNSAQATANDDGLDFILADGLVKFNPGPKDYAILCDVPGSEGLLSHCHQVLDDVMVDSNTIGRSGIDLRMFEPEGYDFAIAMVGHAFGVLICGVLREQWKARPLDVPGALPNGAKKLGMAQTRELERTLRQQKILGDDEMLTFCYGRPHAAKAPAGIDHTRVYY